MRNIVKYGGQIVVYAILMGVTGYFADTPAYRHFPEDKALIKLVVAHGGTHRGECLKLSYDERKKLAPHKRRREVCNRDRLPIRVEFDIDGKTVYAKTVEPTGIQEDGPSKIYEAVPVSVGKHTLALRMRDSERTEGFDYEVERMIELKPEQLYIIQFRAEEGGFLFQ